MDFDQLAYFLKVAERGNFTRAADELQISQPALSRSMQRLETEIGQPVFERQSRRVTLTDAGELLLSRARQMLQIYSDTKREIVDDGQTGEIRIGAIPTIAPFMLPTLLQKSAAEFPKARFHVQELTTDALLKECRDGGVDVAILALPITAKYLEVTELFDEELLLVLPTEHPLIDKKRVELGDLEQFPFVLLDEAHCLTGNVLAVCRQKSFMPVAAERMMQLAMVQELVSLGHGISMIPKMASRIDQSSRRIYRSISGGKPTRTIAMVWNSYRYQSQLVAKFREYLREFQL
jgi:LysR family hydrogen peroxide-inducible transcriptional activator